MPHMYVLADDRRYYADPVVEGKDWYLCFDPDFPPELVVVSCGEQSMADRRYTAERCLTAFGINADIVGTNGHGNRWIGGEYFRTNAWNLKLRSPIPARLIRKSGGRHESPAGGVYVEYCGRGTTPAPDEVDLFEIMSS